MQKVVLASGNEGKRFEIQAMLNSDMPRIELIPQQTLGIDEIVETGLTFVENAILKARHASQCAGLPALADDSGLIVEALHGEPGIYSARYAELRNNSNKNQAKANIEKLLQKMQSFVQSQRNAYFYCVIVYLKYPTDPTPIICQGRWDGNILLSPQGEQGFGYDPIFYVPTHQCSAAELPLDLKNKLSHRGQALQQLCAMMCE